MSNNTFEFKMVLVIRTDLKMSTGKMIAQSCHAAVEASEKAKKTHSKQWRRWRDEGAKKVALEGWSLEELQELANKAKKMDIVNVLIQDAGHTEVPAGTTTVLCLGPDQSQKLDKITGGLSLL